LSADVDNAGVEFRILGPLEVLDGGRDVTPSRPKQRALLALLLLRAGELVTVDEAVDALWGASPPPAARNALQGHVSTLRKILGADRIKTLEGYRIDIEDGELDQDRFERLLSDAQGRHPKERRALLGEALGLFRGQPLADLRDEPFATPEVARLEGLRLKALEERIDADLALRRHEDVVPELEQLAHAHSMHERLHEQLMIALYRSGRQADALAAFQRARRALSEVGLDPGVELVGLQRRILKHDPTLELPPEPRTRLPVPPTPLLGRDRQLAEATTLLLRSDVHVVTLIGPGGVGKTRLALELARLNAGRFRDGVVYVALGALADPSLVLPSIVRGFGLPESQAHRTPIEILDEQLAERETLLVLDNLEHLLDSVSDLGQLVASAPDLTLLVTSRESLRLYGEHLFPVRPLPEDAAIELFLDRAKAVRPDLNRAQARASAMEICARVDRLPLAIELAAAQAAAFEPGELLERLSERLSLLVAGPRDHPERQQTLRNTLAWSHDLLDRGQKTLFARLSVFVGSWTLEASDVVCGEGGEHLAELTALEDKNLVQLTAAAGPEPRLTMLETIREYAAEQLRAADERAARTRHAGFFLTLAENAEPELPSSDGELLDRLELDHDNIRAAIAFLESTQEHQSVLRLVGAVWRFWYLRGHLIEGRCRLETALGHDAEPTLARAKALNGAAAMAINAGDLAAARARAEEGLTLHRRLGDDVGAAYAAFMLANALVEQGELDRARDLYEESIRQFRAHGAEAWSLLASRHLAYLYEEIGERSLARAMHTENLQRARATKSDRFAATSLSALAGLALAEDRAGEALKLLAKSLRLHRALGDLLDTTVDLALYTSALAREGEFEVATCLAAALDTVGDDVGVRRSAVAAHAQQALTVAREHLTAERFDLARQRGKALALQDAVTLAIDTSAAQRE
jgi:predicted ATPase/DNA-binding SARP family transcriptional activator